MVCSCFSLLGERRAQKSHFDSDLADICSLTRNCTIWSELLRNDIDRDFVLGGICFGFKLVSDVNSMLPSDELSYKSPLSGET